MGGTLNSPLPIALYKTTAFIATASRMRVVDTLSGKVAATTSPHNAPDSDSEWASPGQASAPLLATSAGARIVIAPFVVKLTGTGTQASHVAVEVTATSADTRRVLWRVMLRPPEWNSAGALQATVVGADHGVAVIRVSTSDDDYSAAYGIDLNRPRQLWSVDKFEACAVTSEIVAGALLDGDEQRPAGFDLATGKRLWQGSVGTGVGVGSVGPGLLHVRGEDPDNAAPYHRLVDARTGRTLHTLPDDLGDSDTDCTYDGLSVLVCSYGMGGSRVAYGLDAADGKVLWHLPDKRADRIAPKVTTAWHGRVYGETAEGVIALDARTGKDLPSPGAAPLLVNESTGIGLGDSGLTAYPTSS
ncbi:PQQ-binding-like beta-propeller repeat protein [Streptomyces sp. NPDC086787]|uniref:outer membrane protein assembly factor BamB family protein n=1 Tax=Streptomyces sp. NPDC086787 TaxID=3365759 RepID=UPI0038047AF3